MFYIFNILLSLCVLSGGVFATIPDYIKVCKRDQSTINECVLNSINSIRPNLIAGIPDLKVPSLEPFYIPEIIAVSGDLIPLKASGKDVKVSGAGNFSIKSVHVDTDTLTINAKIRFPRLRLEGRYHLDTRILIVPLRGEGNLLADAVRCDADLMLKSKINTKDGQEYLKFTSLSIDINIKDYRLRLDGLFNGNKALVSNPFGVNMAVKVLRAHELRTHETNPDTIHLNTAGDATNEAIDQNRGEFLKTMQPYIEKTVSKIILDSANKIVADIPLSELLPNP